MRFLAKAEGGELRDNNIGNIVSHLLRWKRASRGPVVTIEADTLAMRSWDVPAHMYHAFDVIYLHRNVLAASHTCKGVGMSSNGEPIVVPESSQRHATGALLFTNRRRLTHDLINHSSCLGCRPVQPSTSCNRSSPRASQSITVPIDHWLGCMADHGLLQLGQLCPPLFTQLDCKRRPRDPQCIR